MSLDDIKNGEYHYLSQDELQELLYDLEDALRTIERELKARAKHDD